MKDEQKAKLKKQILSGGLYIALAATVVAITTRGITTILSGGDGYEAPNFKIDGSIYKNESSKNLQLPVIPDITNGNKDEGENAEVADNPGGVSADVNGAATDTAKAEKNVTSNDNSAGEKTPTKQPSENTPQPNSGKAAETETGSKDAKTPASAEVEYPTEPEGNTGYSLYVKPVNGYISKEFSPDELIYSPTMYDYRTHSGIDITGDLGAQVKAFAAGKVTKVYDDPLMGKTVIIDHGDGITSCYMNLYETIPPNITVGASINVGEVIGGVGESAICEVAEVPHLHFEIRKAGIPQDPSIYLRQSSLDTETK